MTNEEAIQELKVFLSNGDFYYLSGDAVNLAIKALEQEPRWIPVSERLPEENVDVLTQYSDDSMSVDFRTATSSGWFWADKNLPIAWMPLPEPYKAESEGSNANSN